MTERDEFGRTALLIAAGALNELDNRGLAAETTSDFEGTKETNGDD